MEKIKFTNIKEMFDCMNGLGGIWVPADDPRNLIKRFVDDHLNHSVEIGVLNIKTSLDQLTDENKAVLGVGNERWNEAIFFGDASLTHEQRYKLSISHMQNVCNYMGGIIKAELSSKSLLRTKGKVEILSDGALPYYESGKNTVYIDETGSYPEVLEAGKDKCCVPLFEIAHNPEMIAETVYDFSALLSTLPKTITSFIETENVFYEDLQKYYGDENFDMVIPIRTDVTALPASDYANGLIGVSIFENIGVMAWRKA
jgi:hypothetical protein